MNISFRLMHCISCRLAYIMNISCFLNLLVFVHLSFLCSEHELE